MAQDKVILLDIQLKTDTLVNNITKAKSALESLKATNKALSDDLLKAKVFGDVAEVERLNKVIEANNTEIRANSREVRQSQQTLDKYNQVQKAEANSYEEITRMLQIKRTELKLMADTLQKNEQGELILTEQYKQQSAEVRKLAEAQIAFDQGIKDGRTNVGNYSDALKGVAESTGIFKGELGNVVEIYKQVKAGAVGVKDGFAQVKEGISVAVDATKNWFSVTNDAGDVATSTSTSVAEIGKASEQVGTKGVSAMTALRGAIASTGVGLLVIAIAAVVNYLRQLDPVVEKVEQLMAGFGATITSVGASLTEVFKGVFSIMKSLVQAFYDPQAALESFKEGITGVSSGFGNLTANASKAAKSAMEYTKVLQDLEDTQRNQIVSNAELEAQAKRARIIESDKTRSARERLAANKEANEAEKKLIAVSVENAKTLLDAEEKRYEQAKVNGANFESIEKARNEAKAKFIELSRQLEDKDVQNVAESAKLRNKLYADELAGRLGLLKEEIRNRELTNRQSYDLQVKLAKEERDGVLKNTEASNAEKLAAAAKYNNDLLEINKKAEDERKAFTQQIEDNALNAIFDGKEKEIAAEALAAQRKIEAVKGNSSEEQALRESIAESSAIKILEIQRKYAEMSQKEREAVIKSDLDLQKRQSDAIAQAETENATSLFNQSKITQEQFNTLKLQIERDRLNRLLDLQLAYQSQRQAQDNEAFANEMGRQAEMYANNEISLQVYLDRKKQITDDYNKQQSQTELETQAATQSTLDALHLNDVANTEATEKAKTDIAKRESDNRQKIREVELQLAGTVLNGFATLLSKDEKMRKDHAAAIKALQIAQIVINTYGEISGYWKGTGADSEKSTIAGAATSVPLATALTALALTRSAFAIGQIAAQPFALGGMTVNGYNAQPMNISGGGFASSPRYGLIGEKGAEYVAPNWQIQRYPELFRMLEVNRITGATPYATGGFTPNSSNINNIIQSVDMNGLVDAVVEGVKSVTIVTTVQDIAIETSKRNLIIDGASF